MIHFNGCADNTSDGSKCSNERELLSAPDTETVQTFNTLEGVKAFQDSLELIDDHDKCGHWEGFEISGKKGPVMALTRRRCITIIRCRSGDDESMTHRLKINERGQLMTDDGTIASLDTLKDLISDTYPWILPEVRKLRKRGVLRPRPIAVFDLIFSENIPSKTFHRAVELVHEGYLEKYEMVAKDKYDKAICELSSKELETLKKEHPIRAGITIGMSFKGVDSMGKDTLDSLQQMVDKKLRSLNLLAVMVNADNEILINGELVEIEEIKKRVLKFLRDTTDITGERRILLENERGTQYDFYSSTKKKIEQAYERRWEQMAEEEHGMPFEELNDKQQKEIRERLPMRVKE